MDLRKMKDIIKTIENSSFVEFEYKDDDFHLILKKKGAFVSENIIAQSNIPQAAPQTVQLSEQKEIKEPAEEEKIDKDLIEIKSPMVATFYKAPSPTSAPYVEIGSEVKKGDVLCILEAMKIMNELESEFPCKIEKILVENAQKVEYDQPLFLVKKLG